jgi:phage tail protein X
MALYYNCKDGDALDMICKNIYGYSRSSVEAVLADSRNREIAKKMPLLEAGDVIYLPDIPKPNGPTIYTNLWN